MDPHTLTDQINKLVVGTNVDTPFITLAVAALICGILAAVTPKALKAFVVVYVAALAGIVYLHQMHYLYVVMAGGLASAVILYPFRPKPKTA